MDGWKSSKYIFLLLIVLYSGLAAGVSPADVLIVDDGHAMPQGAPLDKGEFFSRYNDSLNQMENVNVDVFRTNDSHPQGPDIDRLKKYDMVVWYTLADFEGTPTCEMESSSCKTFYDSDRKNLISYLENYRGRLFLSGQRIQHQQGDTEFFKEKLGSVVSSEETDPTYKECKIKGRILCDPIPYKKDITYDSEGNMSLKGEDSDPVTRDSYFKVFLNKTLAPPSNKLGIVMDKCNFENLGTTECNYADDSFQWRKDSNNEEYLLDYNSNGKNEDYTHGLVRTFRQSSKTVYASFGFETIRNTDQRNQLMNNTFHYLIGPRTDNTLVRDSTNLDYPKYTNGDVNISSTCINRQIQVGTDVTKAEMRVENDNGFQNPRTEEGSYIMDASDGSFDESREDVSYTGYSPSANVDVALSNYPQGYNLSIGVHCRDSRDESGTDTRYWGQLEKDWTIIDTENPVAPDSLSFGENYINTQNTSITVNYQKTADGYKADLVRFSCSSNGPWTDWRVYDSTKAPGTSAPDEKEFNVNITDTSLGCTGPGTDGERTVYADVRDYANNTVSTKLSDSITLDTQKPDFTGADPVNTSYIQENQFLRINATDDRKLSKGVEAPVNEFFNGSVNSTFTPNTSFDPGYTSEGEQELRSWIFDRASNMRDVFLRFVVDSTPPQVDRISPDNNSAMLPGENVTINVSDDRSFDTLKVSNGTQNSSFTGDVIYTPDWKEGYRTLELRLNDSAGNNAFYRYNYTVDGTKPTVTGVKATNESYITNTTVLQFNASDNLTGINSSLYNSGSGNKSFVPGKSFDPGWTTEGTHTLNLYIGDYAGNIRAQMYSYTVDETPPSAFTPYSWSGWSETNISTYINATDNMELARISQCAYSAGSPECTPENVSDFGKNVSLEVGCEEGNTCVKYVRFRANDSAGLNSGIQKSENFSIDKQVPKINISSPREGETRSGVIELKNLINDQGIGIEDANYTVLNASDTTLITSGDLNSSYDWNTVWNSSQNIEGHQEVVLNVSANDRFGHWTSRNLSFTVDNSQTTVTIDRPYREHVGQDFRLVIEARRPGTGDLRYHNYTIKDPEGNVINSTNKSVSGSSHRYNLTVDTGSWSSDGNYTLETNASDTSQGFADSNTWFILDRKPPSAEISSPLNETWQTGEINVNYGAFDTASNYSLSWRYHDGKTWHGNYTTQWGESSFNFKTSNCEDSGAPECIVELNAKDRAGNINTTRKYLKIDNSPPETEILSPAEGSWQNSDFDVERNDTDPQAPEGELTCSKSINGGNWESSSCNSIFQASISDCSEGENTCEVEIKTINPAGLETTDSRYFSIDKTYPRIVDVLPSENSIINDSDSLEVVFSENVSSIDSSIRNTGGTNASLSSGQSFDPGWTESGVKTLEIWLNDSAGNLVNREYSYRFDVDAPNFTKPRFSIPEDEKYGDVRVYRGEELEFQIDVEDNFRTENVVLTVKKDGERNVTLRPPSNLKGGTWREQIGTRSSTGIYNFSALYMTDAAQNRNFSQKMPAFRVVNHSIETDNPQIPAGHVEEFNFTVDFNRTQGDRMFNLSIPESMENTTEFNCVYGGGCRINEGEKLKVETTGNFSELYLETNLSASTPEKDTSYAVETELTGNKQSTSVEILAPELSIENVSCDGCTVGQGENFSLEINATNLDTAENSGKASETFVRVENPDAGIEHTIKTGEVSPGEQLSIETGNFSIEEAGAYELNITFGENLSNTYRNSTLKTVTVNDTFAPDIDNILQTSSSVNLNESLNFTADIKDNTGVDTVLATFESSGTSPENITMEKVAGTRKEGRWKASFNRTDERGVYNATHIYANDSAGNIAAREPGLSYQVTQLEMNASVSPQEMTVEDTAEFSVNVSGNSTALEKAALNVSAQGVQFTEEYEGIQKENVLEFDNFTRSGNYSFNVTVESGASITENTSDVFISYGNTTLSPMDGNSSTLVLPETESPYNLSWRIKAVNGDLQNVSVKLNSTNETVAGSTTTETVGNITFIEGSRTAYTSVDSTSTGIATVSMNAWPEKGGSNFTELDVDVVSSDTIPPEIRNVERDEEPANLEEEIEFNAEITDNSVIDNATLKVESPSGTVSTSVMTHVKRGKFGASYTGSETGEYSYTVNAWDIEGNSDSYTGKFNVTGSYSLNILSDSTQYAKGDSGRFELEVFDADGESVDDFNATIVMDKNGTNVTLVNSTEEPPASYVFRDEDPPSPQVSPDRLPVDYHIYANVSARGNSGSDLEEIGVTRLFEVDWKKPENVQPGEEFTVETSWREPVDEPIDTRSTVYAVCDSCPSDYRIFEMTEQGQYRGTFVAPEEEQQITIQSLAFDGSGNSESQEKFDTPPALTVQVGNTSDSTEETPSFGGGGSTPTVGIQRVSPGASLPASTDSVNLSVSTELPSQCRYSRNKIGQSVAFEEATGFAQTGGAFHSTLLDISQSQTYSYSVMCAAESTNESANIIFTIGEREITSFQPFLPATLTPGNSSVKTGEESSEFFSVFNNGTETLAIDFETSSECCDSWVSREDRRISTAQIERKSEKGFNINVYVPLHVEEGRHSVEIVLSGESSRRKSIQFQVQDNREVERLEELRKKSENLEWRINNYERAGIDTSEMRAEYSNLTEIIEKANSSIQRDELKKLENLTKRGYITADEIEQEMERESFKKYVLLNWWKWGAGFVVFYLLFFLATMVGLPYYRIKMELMTVNRRLDNATEARKKGEKQYFKRQIDEDTFNRMMTDRQNEILELRGEKEDLEEEMDNFVRKQMTLQNYIKAPRKAMNELTKWWEANKRARQNLDGKEEN